MIVPGSVEQEEALIVAKAKLQGTGTWPVVRAWAEAGALAGAGGKSVKEAGGEEGPSSKSSYPGLRTAELAEAMAQARFGAKAGAGAGVHGTFVSM